MLELRLCSLAARGLYAELRRLPAGFQAPLQALARLIGSTVREIRRLFQELAQIGLLFVDGDSWRLERPSSVRRTSTERVRKHRMKRQETPEETRNETRETPDGTLDETRRARAETRARGGFERAADIFKRARAASFSEASSSLEALEKPNAASKLASSPDFHQNEPETAPESEPEPTETPETPEVPKKPPAPETTSPEKQLSDFVFSLVPFLGAPPDDLAGDILRHSPNGLAGVLEAFRASGIEKRIRSGYRIEQYGFFVSLVRAHFARARAS